MSEVQFNPCTIHLTDEQYRKIIDSCSKDVSKQWQDKIKNEIKELEEILEKRKTIDIVEMINRLEELLEEE